MDARAETSVSALRWAWNPSRVAWASSATSARIRACSVTALGFRKSTFVIPQSLTEDRYSLVKIMSRDTILLDEAIIFPWPSREHFKTEFLAMNVTDALQRRAMENLAAETLDKVREVTPHDGKETGSMYLRQQARNYYYYGQMAPMNIFSPTAWQDFFKSWKNGDFKKKDK